MIKFFISFLLVLYIFALTAQPTLAWFGAGYSAGWPNTIQGATGKVISPIYKTPSDSYVVGETVTIKFELENPALNSQVISHNLFLKIWKVDNQDSTATVLNETQLYTNHNNNLDIQSPYKTIPLGVLNLNPGDKTVVSVDFTLENPAYYQFDLTDLSGPYQPGHIYAAGFLRVISPAAAPNNSSQSSNNSSSNSAGPSISSALSSVNNKLTQVIKPVIAQVKENSSPLPISTPVVLDANDSKKGNGNNTLLISIIVLLSLFLLLLLILLYLIRKYLKRLRKRQTRLKSSSMI